jgi:hypothetical protein
MPRYVTRFEAIEKCLDEASNTLDIVNLLEKKLAAMDGEEHEKV